MDNTSEAQKVDSSLLEMVGRFDDLVIERMEKKAVLHGHMSKGMAAFATSTLGGTFGALGASIVAISAMGVAQGSPAHWAAFLGSAAVGAVAGAVYGLNSESLLGPKTLKGDILELGRKIEDMIEQAKEFPMGTINLADQLERRKRLMELKNQPQGLSGNEVAAVSFGSGFAIGGLGR